MALYVIMYLYSNVFGRSIYLAKYLRITINRIRVDILAHIGTRCVN